ncbi:pyruvate formate lyase family protein [Enterococcus sp. AZ126]|uniref:pyruvate formate lyase family protein n=1 Tax=Enterococcus sp. AZ126 TaxID=2774635 RepID=UPI003F686CBE
MCSILTKDYISRGKTIKEGNPFYAFISGLQVGIANLADLLAANRQLVFELWEVLIRNYQSDRSKDIQRMIIQYTSEYKNDEEKEKFI